MLRPMLAQPMLPRFPPSYPLPNRICRISEVIFSGDRNVKTQGLVPAGTRTLTFPQTYRKSSWMCFTNRSYVSLCVARGRYKTPYAHQTRWLTRLSDTQPCPVLQGGLEVPTSSFSLFYNMSQLPPNNKKDTKDKYTSVDRFDLFYSCFSSV